MIKIYKSISIFIMILFCILDASGQTKQKLYSKDSKITIKLNNIDFDVKNSLRTIGEGLKSFNFEKIGSAFETVGDDINREFGDIDFEVLEENPGKLLESSSAEKTRLIVKSYVVDKDDKLAINNQYGKIFIHTWAKNEIKIEIEIKAYESTEQSAVKLLESVKISESRTTNLILFKTNFESSSVNFSSLVKNGKEDRRRLEVTYKVFMPAQNPLDIDNKYGSIEIDDFYGPIKLISTYGSLNAGKLDHPENKIDIKYASANIENYSNGELKISYGNLKLVQADKINAAIKYSNAKIERLRNGGQFDLAYSGGFKIDNVDENVKNLTINSAYSSLILGFDDTADFDFDVTVAYAGFNYLPNRISLEETTPIQQKSKSWNPIKQYRGQIGKGSDSRIIIKSNYGGVRFL